jgi:hypothetical protein
MNPNREFWLEKNTIWQPWCDTQPSNQPFENWSLRDGDGGEVWQIQLPGRRPCVQEFYVPKGLFT